MSLKKPTMQWRGRFRRWLDRQVMRLGLGTAWRSPEPPADTTYPNYVTCPHCDEPEVETWSSESTARCHNCGKSFVVPGEAP